MFSIFKKNEKMTEQFSNRNVNLNDWTVKPIDEVKHRKAAMLLDQEDSLGVLSSRDLMKSLVFFDIGKLEAELVQKVQQEEVWTWKSYVDIMFQRS